MTNARLSEGGIASIFTSAAIVIALVLVISAVWYFSTSEKTLELGQIAPDFTLTDIDGNTFSLRDYRGNVVVVDFMATWCVWCAIEMPDLVDFHENYGHQDVVMFSIDVTTSETEEQLRDFKDEYGAEWTFARDIANVGVTYQVARIPAKYIINQDGIIVWKHAGATSYSALASEVSKLL